MNIDVLKTSLHIEQAHLWSRLNQLFQDSKGERRENEIDITREYYVGLIASIICGLKREAVQDSKHVQTESETNNEDLEEGLEKIKYNNQILNNYLETVSNLAKYPNNANVLLPKECLKGYDPSICSDLIKHTSLNLNEKRYNKFVELLEEKDVLLNSIIASQHLMLLSQRNSRCLHKHSEKGGSGLKIGDDQCYRLKRELEAIKLENERLNIRLELYRSELSRIFSKSESSHSQT